MDDDENGTENHRKPHGAAADPTMVAKMKERMDRLIAAAKNRTQSAATASLRQQDAAYLVKKHGGLDNAVDWLASAAKTIIRKGTMATYRISLRMLATEQERPDLIERLSSIQARDFKLRPTRGASIRAKHIDKEDLVKILLWLSGATKRAARSPNKAADPRWSMRTAWFLLAGIACGAREEEWPSAQIIESQDGILVRLENHKISQIATDAPTFRDVPVSHDKAGNVRDHLKSVRQWIESGQPWEKYKVTCQRIMTRTNNALWGKTRKKRITLYSARHQFHRERESEGTGRETLLYWMGHSGAVNDLIYGHPTRRSKFNPDNSVDTKFKMDTVEA